MQSALGLAPHSLVLLVHNGSLKPHQEFLKEKFPKITHLSLSLNLGFSGGANAGLLEGFRRTAWVLFLTNDCELRELQIPRTKPALITPLIWARREENVDSIGGYFDIQKAHLSHCRNIEDFENSINPYAPGTAFWLHQEVFERASGFDESLGTYWEDVDFSMRIRQLGFPILADLNTKILHAVGKTCHKNSYYTTYLYQRNRKRVSLKYSQTVLMTRTHLFMSWLWLAGKNLRIRNWARLKLLARAIVD